MMFFEMTCFARTVLFAVAVVVVVVALSSLFVQKPNTILVLEYEASVSASVEELNYKSGFVLKIQMMTKIMNSKKIF